MQNAMTDYQYREHLKDVLAIAKRCKDLQEFIEELEKRLKES